MRRFTLFTAILALLISLPVLAATPEVQVVFTTGKVTVLRNGVQVPAQIAEHLDTTDVLTIGRGSALQLAVNGKVLRYNDAAKIRVTDAVTSVGTAENPAMMAALHLLESRGRLLVSTSPAPAQNAKDRKSIMKLVSDETASSTDAMEPASIPNTKLVILEPRSTAVLQGPMRFRWLKVDGATMYTVVLSNQYGEEVFRTETKDTTATWDGATMAPEAEYTWTLATDNITSGDNNGKSVKASFHRLNDLVGMSVQGGESRIRLELGSENPVLPLMLGAFYSQKGLFGEASYDFTLAAAKNPDRAAQFISLACEEYRSNIRLAESELQAIEPSAVLSER